MDKSLLMEKVIAGKASPEEQNEFDRWLSLSKTHREEFEHVKWLTENADHSERDPDDPFYDGWRKIKGRMASIQKKRKIVRMIKIAIGIIVVLVALYCVFYQLGLWDSSGNNWNSSVNFSQTSASRYFFTDASFSQIWTQEFERRFIDRPGASLLKKVADNRAEKGTTYRRSCTRRKSRKN